MKKVSRLVRLALLSAGLACLFALLPSGMSTTYAQVGWCASNPGGVFREGFDSFNNTILNNGYTGNWAWHDGGWNNSTDCFTNTMLTIKECDPFGCSSGNQFDAWDVCHSDSRITRVHSRMQDVLWNPNGRAAYLANDGNTVDLGQVDVDTNCCSQFGLNC